VSAPRGDPPLTAELDESEQRPDTRRRNPVAAPFHDAGVSARTQLSPARDDLRARRPTTRRLLLRDGQAAVRGGRSGAVGARLSARDLSACRVCREPCGSERSRRRTPRYAARDRTGSASPWRPPDSIDDRRSLAATQGAAGAGSGVAYGELCLRAARMRRSRRVAVRSTPGARRATTAATRSPACIDSRGPGVSIFVT
jgi:hypothetical protein